MFGNEDFIFFAKKTQPIPLENETLKLFRSEIRIGKDQFKNDGTTWRIIPVGKWLVTPIYKPFRPFGREATSS